jgi:hypothetical protein
VSKTALFSKITDIVLLIIALVIIFLVITALINNSKSVIQVVYKCSIFNTPETEVKFYTILALVTRTV